MPVETPPIKLYVCVPEGSIWVKGPMTTTNVWAFCQTFPCVTAFALADWNRAFIPIEKLTIVEQAIYGVKDNA